MNAFLRRFLGVYQEVKWLVWPFVLIVLMVLCLRVIVTRQEAYFFINKLHTPAGDFIFPYITELGSVSAAVLISLLLLLISKRKGAMMATAYLFTAAISFTLKAMVGFPVRTVTLLPGYRTSILYRGWPYLITSGAFRPDIACARLPQPPCFLIIQKTRAGRCYTWYWPCW